MSPDEAGKLVRESIAVTREDIARAKAWVLQSECGRLDYLVDRWLAEQKEEVPLNAKVDLMVRTPAARLPITPARSASASRSTKPSGS